MAVHFNDAHHDVSSLCFCGVEQVNLLLRGGDHDQLLKRSLDSYSSNIGSWGSEWWISLEYISVILYTECCSEICIFDVPLAWFNNILRASLPTSRQLWICMNMYIYHQVHLIMWPADCVHLYTYASQLHVFWAPIQIYDDINLFRWHVSRN